MSHTVVDDAPVVVDLMVTGPVFADLVFTGARVPDPGTEVYADAYRFSPGGAANRAVAAARLGARVGLLTCLGDDTLGRPVGDVLGREPLLDLRWVDLRPGWQTPVSIAISGPDDRAFLTYDEAGRPCGEPDGLVGAVALDTGLDSPLPAWAKRLQAAGARVYAGAA